MRSSSSGSSGPPPLGKFRGVLLSASRHRRAHKKADATGPILAELVQKSRGSAIPNAIWDFTLISNLQRLLTLALGRENCARSAPNCRPRLGGAKGGRAWQKVC